MMRLDVGLFGFILFGTLNFLDLYVHFLHQVREVFCHCFFYICFQFLAVCLLLSHHHDVLLEQLKLSQRLLTLSSFFFKFFLPFWVGLFCFLIFLVADLILLLLLLYWIPSKLFLISISISFISEWSFFIVLRFSLHSLSILITNVLNAASSRLLVSI